MTSPEDQQRVAAIPVSTYRLQFNKQFTFAEAARFVPYLRQLGISHCYASPYLKARPGSSHGYDIVDHNELNPEIGTRSGSHYFCESFYEHPCSTSGKNYATANACGGPSRPGHSIATQQGVAHMLSNDSTRFRKACIFTSQAA